MKVGTFTRVLFFSGIFMAGRAETMTFADDPAKTLSELLLSAPPDARQQIVAEFKTRRAKEMAGVVKIVAGSAERLQEAERIDKNAVECHAARLIGIDRTSEAVPLFMKLLTVRDSSFSFESNEWTPHWLSFPFAVALGEIGMPAVNPLLDQIYSSTPGSTRFEIACVTLEKILGKELGAAALEQFAAKMPEPRQPGWLEEAIKQVEIGHVRWSAVTAKDFRLE